jgi:hypothetical protein
MKTSNLRVSVNILALFTFTTANNCQLLLRGSSTNSPGRLPVVSVSVGVITSVPVSPGFVLVVVVVSVPADSLGVITLVPAPSGVISVDSPGFVPVCSLPSWVGSLLSGIKN